MHSTGQQQAAVGVAAQFFRRSRAVFAGILLLGVGTPGLVYAATIPPSTPTDLCLRCHRADPGFSHPVNVTPSMRVPDQLPLQEGKITCLTCHPNDHAASSGTRVQSALRAGPSGPAFCVQCHDSPSSTRRDMHGTMPLRAHLRWSDSQTRTLAARSSKRSDDETRTCLSCHDGTVATDAGGHQAMRGGASHPVGIPYGYRAGHAPSDMFLAPANTLDPRVRLFDNQVACGSCHSPYSTEQNLLVMPNQGSDLCLTCHQQ